MGEEQVSKTAGFDTQRRVYPERWNAPERHSYTPQMAREEVLRAGKRDSFAADFGVHGYTIARVRRNEQSIQVGTTVPADPAGLDALIAALSRRYEKSGIAVSGKLFKDIHGYCEAYRGHRSGRDPETQSLYDYVEANPEVLGGTGPLYTCVTLWRLDETIAFTDFIQEGIVAQVNVLKRGALRSEKNCERHRKTDKNHSLRHMQAFLEQRAYGPVRALRVDGTHTGSGWDIALKDVTREDVPYHRKL